MEPNRSHTSRLVASHRLVWDYESYGSEDKLKAFFSCSLSQVVYNSFSLN